MSGGVRGRLGEPATPQNILSAATQDIPLGWPFRGGQASRFPLVHRHERVPRHHPSDSAPLVSDWNVEGRSSHHCKDVAGKAARKENNPYPLDGDCHPVTNGNGVAGRLAES